MSGDQKSICPVLPKHPLALRQISLNTTWTCTSFNESLHAMGMLAEVTYASNSNVKVGRQLIVLTRSPVVKFNKVFHSQIDSTINPKLPPITTREE
jgi:hypothetical protein